MFIKETMKAFIIYWRDITSVELSALHGSFKPHNKPEVVLILTLLHITNKETEA